MHNWMNEMFGQGAAATEPSAELREAASAMRQLYVALVNEGFTERQALEITIKAVLAGGKS